MWVSTDAHDWERIDPNLAAFSNQSGLDVFMLDVAAGPTGFIIVGTEGGTQVAIWQSPDGRSWTRIDTADQPFGTTGALSSVAVLGSGFTAAGPGFDEGEGPVTLWTSPDGLTWNRVGELGPGSAQAIFVTDTGIAVVGQAITGLGADDYHASVWLGPGVDPNSPPPDPLQP